MLEILSMRAWMQDLDDDLHHEDDESAGLATFSLSRLLEVDWATSHSLKLGDNDFQPAILLQFAKGSYRSEGQDLTMHFQVAVLHLTGWQMHNLYC